MSTTPAVATPETVGQEIKDFFSKVGKELGVIGTDALKEIGVISKDVSVYEPLIAATISDMFPGAAVPIAAIQKIISSSLNTASTVASALQAEGLNPTLNQAAAIAVATQVHLSSSTVAQVTAAVGTATTAVDTAAGQPPATS